MFLDCFDILVLKNKKIYYYNVFSSKKHFKKQTSLNSQTHPMLKNKKFQHL